MVNDPIGDMIARIKNAAQRGRNKVATPASKMRARVLDVLADEGYIRGYQLVQKPGAFPEFEIELKYFDGQPVIVEISRVSKPGRRVYSSIKDLKPVKNGLGISILSPPLVSNMVVGVTEGYERKLELVGVGYRAAMKGQALSMQLGFSHDVDIPPPEGVAFATPKQTEITISGIDKQLVGEVAARIRRIRPPEPYKGKGVRYAGEKVRRKEGKKK